MDLQLANVGHIVGPLLSGLSINKGGCMFSQTYYTVRGDKERYEDRLTEIASRPNKAATKQPDAYIQSEAPGRDGLSH